MLSRRNPALIGLRVVRAGEHGASALRGREREGQAQRGSDDHNVLEGTRTSPSALRPWYPVNCGPGGP